MELTSLPAYSLTQPDKTVSSLCAYLVLPLLTPSILWNKMTSSNRQTWETAVCVTMLESTGAFQMAPTSILSLSKQFNENAVINWSAENHLSRLAIILYRVKKEPYHLSPKQILSAATHMLWALCVSVTCPSNVGRTPTPMSCANGYQRTVLLGTFTFPAVMVDGKVKRRFAQGPADLCQSQEATVFSSQLRGDTGKPQIPAVKWCKTNRTPTNYSQNTLNVTEGFFAHFLYGITLCNDYLIDLVKIPDKYLGQVV